MNVDEGTETLTIVELWEKYGREWDVQVATPKTTGRKGKGKKEEALLALLGRMEAVGLPTPVREYTFHPTRNWRFDLCWPDLMLAGEVEGGIWMQTRTGRGKGHAHPVRFTQDCEKYNEATILGYRLIRVTTDMIKSGEALDFFTRALAAAGEGE